MCGISAIFALKGGHIIQDSYSQNIETAIHRGPDGKGAEYFSKFTGEYGEKCESAIPLFSGSLAHCRLSIIDLSPAGHQPMSYGDERYWIVYNGEVYNYREIREDLESLGHRFKSHTDTVVVLAAYVQWGKDCLSRFNGMWAFVIVDMETGSVFASRDRFGVKPLYYWFSPEGFLAFASEIKQFTVLPGWDALLNRKRAYDYLTFGLLDHTDETMFEGVFQVRGGEAVEFSTENLLPPLPIYRWYTLETKNFTGSREEAAAEFRSLLTDAVRLRLRSDVPIGSCLSGGLDSSSIVCIVNDILKEGGDESVQKTFSAVSREKRVDESPWIREVVSCRTIESLSVFPHMEDLFRELDDILWHQDEPFESTSIFAQWNVFRLASQHNVKVMLDGQGADEMLGGYHYFFGIHFAGLLSKMKLSTLAREMKGARDLHGYHVRNDLGRILYYTLPGAFQEIFSWILPQKKDAKEWFNLDTLSKEPGTLPFTGTRYRDPFTDQCYTRLLQTNLPALLHWEDRNSMAFSIESRVPFLDYRLVEFSMSLPSEYKISGGMTKKVLRDAMAGIIPGKIGGRIDKLGFATPEEEWIRKNPDIWRERMQDSIKFSGGIVKAAAVKHFDEVIRGEREFTQHIWRSICFGQWMKRFGVRCE